MLASLCRYCEYGLLFMALICLVAVLPNSMVSAQENGQDNPAAETPSHADDQAESRAESETNKQDEADQAPVITKETIQQEDTEQQKEEVEDESGQEDSDADAAEDSKEDAEEEDAEGEEDGQADLDRAFQLKITASSIRDLDKVADLCESAIDKGLPQESVDQATELWCRVLIDHALQLNRRIAPKGQLSTRWRWLRSQAISRLDKAIELRPSKIDALILLAKLHSLNAGDKDAAMEAIEKAIAQLTDDKEKLSEALYIRARLAKDEPSRLADLTQAVKINPKNFEALMERAAYFLGKEKPEEAMVDFLAIVDIEKDNTDRFILISQVLRRKEMLDESIQILDLAIESNPEEGDLYLLRGQANLSAQNDDAALQDLNKALDIDRQNTDALNLRARVYMVKEDFENAINDANELIQQKPNETSGLELRSLIYRSQSDLDKAIEDLGSLLEIVPGNLDYKFDLAILYSANEQPSKAIALFDDLVSKLTSSPVLSQILRNRGDAHLSLGQHSRAIQDYETALDILGENEGSDKDGMSDEREKDMKAGLLNNLSWVLSTSPSDDLRDGARAIELATEAAEMTDFKAAFILSTLAAGYAEVDDFDAAQKWSAKAVELAESDEQRKGLQDELDSFKQGKPWREIENVEEEKENSKDESGGDESDDEGSDDEGAKPDDEADESEKNDAEESESDDRQANDDEKEDGEKDD